MIKTTAKSSQKRPPSANQEVEMLRNLSQAATAWALGISPRSLRDKPGLPREANGRYDVSRVIAQQRTAPTWPDLPPEVEERLLHIAQQCVWGGYGRGISAPIGFTHVLRGSARRIVADLRREHGDAIVVRLYELLEMEAETEYGPPTEPQPSDKPCLTCPRCGKIRQGLEWVKSPPPRGTMPYGIICEKCDEAENG